MPPQDELANFGSLKGLDDDQLRLLASRATPQPFGTFTQPLRLENPARAGLPKLGMLCSFPMDQVRQMIASDDHVYSELAGPEWRFAELPTGHYPMLSSPRTSRSCSSISPRRDPFGATPVRPRGILSEGYEPGNEVLA